MRAADNVGFQFVVRFYPETDILVALVKFPCEFLGKFLQGVIHVTQAFLGQLRDLLRLQVVLPAHVYYRANNKRLPQHGFQKLLFLSVKLYAGKGDCRIVSLGLAAHGVRLFQHRRKLGVIICLRT